jgi:hypothetical protein
MRPGRLACGPLEVHPAVALPLNRSIKGKVAPMGTASQVDWGLAVERESVIRPLAEEEKPPTGDYKRL